MFFFVAPLRFVSWWARGPPGFAVGGPREGAKPEMAVVATSSDHPVIGGNAADTEVIKPPLTDNVMGPGAGNLSGLVLALCIFTALGLAASARIVKMHKAARRHSAAQKMANQLKMAAMITNRDENKVKSKSKKKGPAVDRRLHTKFTPLGQDEDAEEEVTVEACGELNSEEELPAADGDVPEDECCPATCSRKKAADTVAGLSFGATRQAEPACILGFDGGHHDQATVYYDIECAVRGADEGDVDDLVQMDDVDEDEISPNDSVSNIGFPHVIERLTPLGVMAKPRTKMRSGGRLKKRGSGDRAVPCVVEGAGGIDIDDEMVLPKSARKREKTVTNKATAVKKILADVDSTREIPFMTLGELESIRDDNPFRSKKPSKDDDAFSMVHEKHLAMRKNIPGDEMRIRLTHNAAAARQIPKAQHPLVVPSVEATQLLDDDDDDGSDSVLFGGGGNRITVPARNDGSGSDVGSAVTFNFDMMASKKPEKQPAEPQLIKPPPTSKPSHLTPANMKPPSKPSWLLETGRREMTTVIYGEEDEGSGVNDGNPDDDMTMVSESLGVRPRDPYLGMRDGRYMGGGRVGLDGKWTGGGRQAQPAHRFEDYV